MPPGTSGSSIVTDPSTACPASAPRSWIRVSGSIAIPASRPAARLRPAAARRGRRGRSGPSGPRSRRRGGPGRRPRCAPAASGRAGGRWSPDGASIREASSCLDWGTSLSRQPFRCASSPGSMPRSVIPVSPSSRPTPPVSRSTGVASTPGSRGEACDRRRVLHRDQAPQVLPDDVVERNPVRRLVTLAASERRAIALGEESQTEADDEEGRGRDRVAGVARERERGDPQAERAAAREPLDEP